MDREASPNITNDQENRSSRRRVASGANKQKQSFPQATGGYFRPLSHEQCDQIHAAVLEILDTIGLTDAPADLVTLVCGSGGQLTDDGRLRFGPDLVARALAGVRKEFTLHGQQPQFDMLMNGHTVYAGTGGAAPFVYDPDVGDYRPSTLSDLFDAARLVDSLDNVDFFARSLVARDVEDERSLDLNTAVACLCGTRKHVMTSASSPDHVSDIAEICYEIAGSEAEFRERPFLSLNINHVVPPLRFHHDSCLVMAEAVRAGIPVNANVFGQLGASSPVTLAGSVAQTVAEALAGVILAWLVDADARVVCGPRPMVTDLRSGAMSGGSGEQALATAMAVQMMQYYGIVNSTIAGATDSKLPDAQAGYEKALSITLAVHAGANLVTQACGMQAGLMGVSFAAYVIDNDMLGAIDRSASKVEVSQESLAVENIQKVVSQEGHFLGQVETYARMKSDFLYPEIADRRSPDEWVASGSPDIHQIARERANQLLASHKPSHIDRSIIDRIARRFALHTMFLTQDTRI